MTRRYLEDFAVGQTFGSRQLKIDGERIKAFAAEFDPQPFHIDEERARDTLFGGLAASGWHTAALTMRLLLESEVLELRPSKSRPEIGIMRVKLTTYNQANEVVQIAHPIMIVPRRPAK